VHGEELWKTDGGPLGSGHTEQVADIYPGSAGSIPSTFAVFDGLLWFRVTNTNPAGSELWNTDGTSVKTFDINPGPPSSIPDGLVAGPNALFFSADDGVHGIELWKASVEPAPSPPSGGGGPASPAPAPSHKKKCKKKKHRAAVAKKKCKKK
jgi:ELWxxDGT repeat protein